MYISWFRGGINHCFLATQSLAAGALRGRGEESNETRVKLFCQQGEGGAEVVGRGGADDSGEFLAVLKHDERGPELDAEGAAEAPAGAVFDLDVRDVGEVAERSLDGGGGELAISERHNSQWLRSQYSRNA
jgi:hypothetical protein